MQNIFPVVSKWEKKLLTILLRSNLTFKQLETKGEVKKNKWTFIQGRYVGVGGGLVSMYVGQITELNFSEKN